MTPEAWRLEEELLHVMNFAAEGPLLDRKPSHLSGTPRRQSDLGASNWAERLRALGEDQKAPLAVNLSPAMLLTGACGHSSEVGPGSGFLLSL